MISSLVEYLSAIKGLNLENSDLSSTTTPWFRGQTDLSWHLVPSMYRGDWKFAREREITRDFRLRASIEVEQKSTSDLGWLFVMQHHGIPTRLLDWTESSLFALYFAVENYRIACDAAVWVMHPWNLNKSPESYGEKSVPNLNEQIIKDYLFPEHTVGNPRVSKDLPMALRPVHTSRRIVAQRGQFTIHGQEKIGLDEIPRSRADINLKKLEIEGRSKLKILRELYQVGISRYSLFPDLDGLALEIRTRYSKEFMG